MAEIDLKTLEFRIHELIQMCERLREENRSLRTQQASLTTERAHLIEKNEQARMKVEGILQRLKSMERE
ncbi:MAG: TIGR02449 family protein [Gammaproteobacteria bacterium]|nr:TIGR02449 family protein [Gammaproteobacteria bacterium]